MAKTKGLGRGLDALLGGSENSVSANSAEQVQASMAIDALQPGQSLQLLNDHDPQPLRFQLDDRAFGQFEWATLESGPEVWRVQITRVGARSPQASSDSCCAGGACCG